MPFQKGNTLRLGTKSPHTVEREMHRKVLFDEVRKEYSSVVQALIKKAKEGDVQAIKELNERVLGKETLPLETTEIMKLIKIDE